MSAQPEPLDEHPAVTASRSFVQAIVWGEHSRVWELLSREGREAVLRIGADRGMPETLLARLRDGTAAQRERDEFLADLVNGLRADLHGNDVDSLEYELGPEHWDESLAQVLAVAPLPEPLGAPLPAASIELTEEDGAWRVVRLVPRLGR